MKKNNKKGFTLVELLAVLLVMAILALIAVPMVVNVINKARKQAYQRSVEAYVRSVENAIAAWAMENPNKKYSTELAAYQDYIDIKGDQVTCSTVDIRPETGKLTLLGCTTTKSKQKNPDFELGYVKGSVKEEQQLSWEETESFILGDCFVDGEVNSRDVTLIQKYPNDVELSELQKAAADVDRNGVIDTEDVKILQKFIVGIKKVKGIGEYNCPMNTDSFVYKLVKDQDTNRTYCKRFAI